jgi:hypothetical protein
MVWFAEPVAEAGPDAGRICRRHADAMVLPKGWWLDDRRGGDSLFAAKEPVAVAVAPAKPRRPRKPKAPPPALLPEAAAPAAAPGEAEAPAWTPAFDATDDLGGQLDASTPLLSRAFGGSAPPPKRSTRRRPPATPR